MQRCQTGQEPGRRRCGFRLEELAQEETRICWTQPHDFPGEVPQAEQERTEWPPRTETSSVISVLGKLSFIYPKEPLAAHTPHLCLVTPDGVLRSLGKIKRTEGDTKSVRGGAKPKGAKTKQLSVGRAEG